MSARPSGTVDEESENYFKKFFEKLKFSSQHRRYIFSFAWVLQIMIF